tara:strand:+ start:403 stop:618 length:216 start_codon:yes stop_codon:yes gene_type:complete
MVKLERFVRYESFIIVGAVLVFLSFGKLTGFHNLSSDWFWFLAGCGLVVDGVISLIKQKRFDRKYRIIERQ